jgi:U3 small nucleolar RNA-associated protein 18
MLEHGRKSSLASGRLEYRKLQDLNYTTHSEGAVIRAAEFHPSATVALVAGLNGTASLFRVDGKDNPKMQTVNFEDFPIRTAHFSADGSEFVAGSQQHEHFFVYDMEKGKSVSEMLRELILCALL